jgi:hypothetical protein
LSYKLERAGRHQVTHQRTDPATVTVGPRYQRYKRLAKPNTSTARRHSALVAARAIAMTGDCCTLVTLDLQENPAVADVL